MTWFQQQAMDPIPEEEAEDGFEWRLSPSSSTGRRTTTRKREVFTSEQVDTLFSTVPKGAVPSDWNIENEVVDPQMATSYMTESLFGPTSARGTSYTYTVTKVTTTRSVKQIPVESPYSDIYFDAAGFPTPSPPVEGEVPSTDSGSRLEKVGRSRSAPPPAPPPAPPLERDVPSAPSAPDVIDTADGEVTLAWSAPLQKPNGTKVFGYQVELREFPNGDWERAHDQLLQDTVCTSEHFAL
ncbi:hypothetical protein DICVIV_05946 [Dictyocaulus viviparus]|uniref:Fibronectin type-III domain-containing protein n=1 Tax=Dictyocaulus viviparus TaxID=29172 RepID=A0A0D8XTW9_DICVI|nr:hypothetical protein DICVIV_05946 [Dictyocaulus viviparus]